MSGRADAEAAGRGPALELVPRKKGQGYGDEDIAERRRWVEAKTGSRLDHIGASTLSGESLRGNIENPIGVSQVPLGVAGPLLVHGEHAQGVFYVPLATTEGALVRSYERGMAVLTRAGGVTTRVVRDENRVSPLFSCADAAHAVTLARQLREDFDILKEHAERTTRHGRLVAIETQPLGRKVLAHFRYTTADAQGMNMIVKATEAACRHIAVSHGVTFSLFSGASAEKRAAASLLAGGKGKEVVAGAHVPAQLVRRLLRTSPQELHEMWQHTVLGHLQAGALGYNGHLANGLTALFIACGQDVANVVNSAVGITQLEVTGDGDLYASVTLPALTVATVGGGTGLGTARECLEMLDCFGSGRAGRLAEVFAATLLAGELSFGSAIASGEFVAAHETYGRNRPPEGAE